MSPNQGNQPTMTPLWDQTEGATGVVPSVKAALSGPASQALGPEAAATGVIESRQNFANAKNDLIRALSINPKYPVAEITRLDREINITPNAWDSSSTLRAKMSAVNQYLKRRLVNERRIQGDQSLPAAARKDSAHAAVAIENFLGALGAPDDTSGSNAASGVTRVQDDAGFDALPPGTQFMGPDGILRVKP